MKNANSVLFAAILAASFFGAGLLTEASLGSLIPNDAADGSFDDLPRGIATQEVMDQVVAAFAEAASGSDACPYEDQSSGMGGQSGECTFLCPPPGGEFTVEVEADDSDADVSGTASCGRHDIHCSGQKYCSETGAYSAEADGECSGDSDEFWDSGIYINCWANAEDVPGPGSSERCIVTEPIKVCYQVPPDAGVVGFICGAVNCHLDGDGALTLSADKGGSSAHLGYADGSGYGAICDFTGTCDLVVLVPTFPEDGGITLRL